MVSDKFKDIRKRH